MNRFDRWKQLIAAGCPLIGLVMLAGGCAERKSRAQLEREWFECGLAAGQGAREQGRANDVFAVQSAQDGCFAVKNPTDAYHGVVIQGGYER